MIIQFCSHCTDRSQDEVLSGLDFGELNITSQDEDILDEAAGHIQENLEDELVQEALRKVGHAHYSWGRGYLLDDECYCLLLLAGRDWICGSTPDRLRLNYARWRSAPSRTVSPLPTCIYQHTAEYQHTADSDVM